MNYEFMHVTAVVIVVAVAVVLPCGLGTVLAIGWLPGPPDFAGCCLSEQSWGAAGISRMDSHAFCF